MNELDKEVQALFDIVEEKKKKVGKLERPKYETNLSFKYDNNSTPLNLNVVNPIELTKIVGWLISSEEMFEKGKKVVGTTGKFSHQGFTAEQWIEDIKILINKINISELKADLAKDEEILNSLLSEDQKRAIKIAELKKKHSA